MSESRLLSNISVSVVGGNFKSVEDVASKQLKKASTSTSLSIVHCESLVTMRGLQRFPLLTNLTLSGNNLSRIEYLENVPSLVKLDLSANRLTTIEGLTTLLSLEILDLSGNMIASIQGLLPISGPQFNLREVFLAGNQIFDVRELEILSK